MGSDKPFSVTILQYFVLILFLLPTPYFLLPTSLYAADTAVSKDPASSSKTSADTNKDAKASDGKQVKPEAKNRLIEKMIRAAKQENLKQKEEIKTIALKLMIVNPSKKYKQIYHLKQPLPPEIEPQHVVEKGEMSVGYDANNKTYFVSQDIELDPGQSVLKEIKVQDVWSISEDHLKELSSEAAEHYEKLQGTPFEDKAKFLLNNLEVILAQILELQNDDSLTADEHIQAFRTNKEKLREVELDLALMRRLIVTAAGDGGALVEGREGKSAGSGFLGNSHLTKSLAEKADKGSIPAWVAWRVIFMILIFLCVSSIAFYVSWARQMRLIERRRRQVIRIRQETKISDDKLRFEDILPHKDEPSFLERKKPNPDGR